jgi:TolA-binding protein
VSEETTALVPIEERQVKFYEDEITAALVEFDNQEQIFVPIRPICEYLGVDPQAQTRRIRRDMVLSEHLQGVAIMATPSGNKRSSGGAQTALALPLEMLPGWLFGIDASRVKPELRDKVVRYQRECFRVLWKAFQSEAFSQAASDEASSATTSLTQIRNMGLAIAELAEQQIAMEKRLSSRLDQAAVVVRELQRRVGVVEKKLTPASLITDEQAAEVSQAVKALADYLKSKDASKNHYQAAFSEIYRRFGVSSYKNIRADQFADVLKFLEDWRKTGK